MLFGLGVLVAAASLGPGTLGELLSGVTFARPPTTSIALPTSHADASLQRRLDDVAAGISRGSMAAVAMDLGRGGTASVAADRSLPAASLFKLPIMLEVLAAEDSGRLEPARELEIRPEDWTDGSGVLQARVGERLPVNELTRLMIQASDNIAALVLLDAVGVEAVNARAASLGLATTRVVDHRAGEPGEHTTSAADMAHLLVLIASGQAINARVSEAALNLLERPQSVTWLADGLPFWVRVAHKWGDIDGARNDVGIVFTPRGNYALAVLTSGVPADEAARAIGQTSRATYAWLRSST